MRYIHTFGSCVFPLPIGYRTIPRQVSFTAVRVSGSSHLRNQVIRTFILCSLQSSLLSLLLILEGLVILILILFLFLGSLQHESDWDERR